MLTIYQANDVIKISLNFHIIISWLSHWNIDCGASMLFNFWLIALLLGTYKNTQLMAVRPQSYTLYLHFTSILFVVLQPFYTSFIDLRVQLLQKGIATEQIFPTCSHPNSSHAAVWSRGLHLVSGDTRYPFVVAGWCTQPPWCTMGLLRSEPNALMVLLRGSIQHTMDCALRVLSWCPRSNLLWLNLSKKPLSC